MVDSCSRWKIRSLSPTLLILAKNTLVLEHLWSQGMLMVKGPWDLETSFSSCVRVGTARMLTWREDGSGWCHRGRKDPVMSVWINSGGVNPGSVGSAGIWCELSWLSPPALSWLGLSQLSVCAELVDLESLWNREEGGSWEWWSSGLASAGSAEQRCSGWWGLECSWAPALPFLWEPEGLEWAAAGDLLPAFQEGLSPPNPGNWEENLIPYWGCA